MKTALRLLTVLLILASPAWATHRYWRVYVWSVVGGNTVSCAELALHIIPGGTNIAIAGTPEASSFAVGQPASQCFDADTSTYWESGSGTLPEWIGYDLGIGSPADVVEFVWTSRADASNQNPTLLQLQYSDDNSTWTGLWPAFNYTGGWTDGQSVTFTEPGYDQPPGVSVSKSQAYSQNSIPSAVSVSKSNAYSNVVPPLAGISVSKGVVYVMLGPGEKTRSSELYGLAQLVKKWHGQDAHATSDSINLTIAAAIVEKGECARFLQPRRSERAAPAAIVETGDSSRKVRGKNGQKRNHNALRSCDLTDLLRSFFR